MTAEQQVKSFETNMRAIVRRMQADILSGKVVANMMSLSNAERVLYQQEVYSSLLGALNSSGYDKIVADLINKDKELIASVKTTRAGAGLPTAFTTRSKEVLDAVRNLELTRFNHIGQSFVQTLHSELMNFAISGMSEADFIIKLQDALEGKFVRYATTYAETSRAQFIQAVGDEAARSAGGEHYWEYVGAEDDKNRDACIEGLAKRYFTDAEREQFEADYADERAWNCRHTFMEINKDTYFEEKGE